MASTALNQELQALILQTLDAQSSISDTSQLVVPSSSSQPVEQQLVQSVLTSLASRSIVKYAQHEQEVWRLTAEGSTIAEGGSHEAKVFDAIAKQMEGLTIAELTTAVGSSAKFGQGPAIKNGWIKKGDGGKFVKQVDSIQDTTREQLLEIQRLGTLASSPSALKDLSKRKFIEKKKIYYFSVKKGPEFTLDIKKQETDISVEMLHSGSWKNSTFKPYNFNAMGIPPKVGALHPLMKMREEFRNIFFEMGFEEMPTNTFVESSFWNFDALFVPQQHPARDLQDTFYLSSPSHTTTSPPNADYLERVRKVHQEGDYGSIGYRYPWSKEESSKLVLRTHTTATSTQMLYKLANRPGGFKPARMFSIDRVFRNETVDATHLAEFHQVEGVIADYGLTLGDLIGFMQTFFEKQGLKDLRFKPAYNPYTEPSLEIFAFHPHLNKWVEIGNSGMFRPEMLEAMGLPKDVKVHGWGLSLERPTMITTGCANIRELLGHKCSIEWIESQPAVRLDKATVA